MALVACLASWALAAEWVPAEAPPGLGVGLYNIQYGQGIDGTYSPARIANVIRPAVPDIVGLNEVYHNNPLYGLHHTDARIAEELGPEWTAIHGRTFTVAGFIHYGNSILTRLPVLSSQNHLLSKSPDFEQRGALRVTVEWNGGPLHVICTHLGLNSPERLRHVDEILAIVEDLGEGPVMIIGDFNEQPAGSVPRNFKLAGYVDAYRRHGVEPGHTFGNPDPYWRIDFHMADPRFQAASIYVPDDPLAQVASDHRPVFAQYYWMPDDPGGPGNATEGVLFDTEGAIGFDAALEGAIETSDGFPESARSRVRFLGGRHHWQLYASQLAISSLPLPAIQPSDGSLEVAVQGRAMATPPQGYRIALTQGEVEIAAVDLSRNGAGSWLATGHGGGESGSAVNLTSAGLDPLAPQDYRFLFQENTGAEEASVSLLAGHVEVFAGSRGEGALPSEGLSVQVTLRGTPEWRSEFLVHRIVARDQPGAGALPLPILYPNQHLGVHHDPERSAFQSVRGAVATATGLGPGPMTPVRIDVLSEGPFSESEIQVGSDLFDNDFTLTARGQLRPVVLSEATGWNALTIQRQGRTIIEDLVLIPTSGSGQKAFRAIDILDPASPLGYDIELNRILISSNDGNDAPVASLDGKADPGVDPENPGPVTSFRGNGIKVRSTEVGVGRVYRLHMRDVVVSGMLGGTTSTGGYGIRGFMNGAEGSEWVIGEGTVISYNQNLSGNERAALQPGGNEGSASIFRVEGTPEKPVLIHGNRGMDGVHLSSTTFAGSRKGFSWMAVTANEGRGLISGDTDEDYGFANVTFAGNGGLAISLPVGHTGNHAAHDVILAGNGSIAGPENTLLIGSADGSFAITHGAIVAEGPWRFSEATEPETWAGVLLDGVIQADPQFLSITPGAEGFLAPTNPVYAGAGPEGAPLRGAGSYKGPESASTGNIWTLH